MKTLFERLGGEKAIAAVVNDFIDRAAANPKVNFNRDGRYANMNITNHKKILLEFISMAAGGPIKYAGREMGKAHAGLGIKGSEFDALAADLLATLKKFDVPENEKQELMALAASTRSSIVEL